MAPIASPWRTRATQVTQRILKLFLKIPFKISVYCLKVVGFQEFSSSREKVISYVSKLNIGAGPMIRNAIKFDIAPTSVMYFGSRIRSHMLPIPGAVIA